MIKCKKHISIVIAFKSSPAIMMCNRSRGHRGKCIPWPQKATVWNGELVMIPAASSSQRVLKQLRNTRELLISAEVKAYENDLRTNKNGA